MSVAQPQRVVICAYHGLSMLEYGAAVEIFISHGRTNTPWYQGEVVSCDGPQVELGDGSRLLLPADLQVLQQADMIVLPGWRNIDERPPQALLLALQQAAARGARLVSFCSGAVILAYAGLLDGKTATTHWKYAKKFKQLFPQVQLDTAPLYVQAGQIFTSAGSAACIDLALALIEADFGLIQANISARRLVVPLARQGGQRQFIELPVSTASKTLSRVLDTVLQNLAQPWDIAVLAQQAGMSRRSFDRHFQQSVGQSAKQWLQQARIEQAKILLSRGERVELVAEHCGFASGSAFRAQFAQWTGVAPSQFRQAQQQRALLLVD
jgi:AraC family transcriptional activator FtrA